ncbi:MAG: sugar transferase [Anaerolineaceae bacterium]|nr:sugar transferase [Anaerolineaceae bacterium]
MAEKPALLKTLKRRWKGLYCLPALGLTWAGWVLLPRIGGTDSAGLVGWFSIALIGLHALAAMLLVEALEPAGLSPGWMYRGAFLLSAGLGAIFWLERWAAAGVAPNFWDLPLAGLGAFSGGLLSTSLREGFEENNSPPSDAVKEEVLRRHREVIGLPPPLPGSKRLFDVVLAAGGLAVSMPLWLLISFLIWIEAPGAVFFSKNSVGLGGRTFHQFKFRTMVNHAEQKTGPIVAAEGDERVLWMGGFLRKTALDELPQLLNILKGEMSFVGPRPQRTVLVHEYLKRMPEYAWRHQAPPGLAGLAQVAGSYYLSPQEKLKWDRIYLERASLGYDLRLLALAFVLVFYLRWKGGGDEALPRRWLGLD